ncbi:hypothetical protein R1flu_007704 [Riccia fluitans]|uniref:Uncharacterized protein n=1 Tax=Riccia fluitans TaxID=41844 RepID=A0ABD1YZW1_9MARC
MKDAIARKEILSNVDQFRLMSRKADPNAGEDHYRSENEELSVEVEFSGESAENEEELSTDDLSILRDALDRIGFE